MKRGIFLIVVICLSTTLLVDGKKKSKEEKVKKAPKRQQFAMEDVVKDEDVLDQVVPEPHLGMLVTFGEDW